MGKGRIPSRYVDLLATDLANIIQPWRHGVHETSIHCAMAQFDVATGEMTSRSLLFDTETNAQLADLSLLIALHDLGIDYPTRHLEALDAVTLEQVNAAGRRHIHPNPLHTVAAGKGEVG